MYPGTRHEEVDEVVDLLWDSGVSDEDLASFSFALQILDSLTAAYLRPQDWLECLASKVYVKGTRLNFVLPPECKNKDALEKSEIGLVVNHAKSKRTKGEHLSRVCVSLAYMLRVGNVYNCTYMYLTMPDARRPLCGHAVIGRRLMRKHLVAGFQRARANVAAIRASTKTQVEKAEKALAACRGLDGEKKAEKDLERVTKPLATAYGILTGTRPPKKRLQMNQRGLGMKAGWNERLSMRSSGTKFVPSRNTEITTTRSSSASCTNTLDDLPWACLLSDPISSAPYTSLM